jgi:hypothetical protein
VTCVSILVAPVRRRNRGAAPQPSYDHATFAYDASTGATLWASRYNGSGNDADFPAALRASPGGSAVSVTGASTGSTRHLDYASVAYRA